MVGAVDLADLSNFVEGLIGFLLYQGAPGASLVLGLTGQRWRWAWPVPAFWVAVAIVGYLNEGEGYDMPGFSLIVGGIMAFVCLAFFAVGSVLHAFWQRFLRR